MMLHKCLGFCGSKNESSSKKHYLTVIEELCRQFSLEDLRKSTNNFDEKLVVGRGAFGTVYKGCLKHHGATDYAVALMRLNKKYDHGSLKFEKEIEFLCQLRHPNLVSLIGFYSHKMEKIIVYEYMPNGSLHDHLQNRDIEPLSWKKRLEICIGAARGLHYLHTGAKRTIFHLHVNPSSILLDNNMEPKLSDFGLSIQGPLSTSKPKPVEAEAEISGTVGYLAPEFVIQSMVTDKCDVYSFGIVLLQVACTSDMNMIVYKAKMLSNQQLGEGGSEYHSWTWASLLKILTFLRKFAIEEIIDPVLKGKIAPECWEVFIDITKRCLKNEPDERPTIGEVQVLLEHALSLQEEADIAKANDDYTLLSTTMVFDELEINSSNATPSRSFDDQESDYNLNT